MIKTYQTKFHTIKSEIVKFGIKLQKMCINKFMGVVPEWSEKDSNPTT